jgi:Arc/MetJ-type ribon-helix-helix transcriptional regulator
VKRKMNKNKMEKRVTVRVTDSDRQQIEQVIKKEYPKLKNYSDVVRLALNKFLTGYAS